jgi:hypothetical protein
LYENTAEWFYQQYKIINKLQSILKIGTSSSPIRKDNFNNRQYDSTIIAAIDKAVTYANSQGFITTRPYEGAVSDSSFDGSNWSGYVAVSTAIFTASIDESDFSYLLDTYILSTYPPLIGFDPGGDYDNQGLNLILNKYSLANSELSEKSGINIITDRIGNYNYTIYPLASIPNATYHRLGWLPVTIRIMVKFTGENGFQFKDW